MDTVIEVVELSKKYNSHIAVNQLSLQVYAGEVFGFIGPNGAGKTTTIRILTTLLKPTSGDAFIGGYSVTTNKHEVRKQIGYMPDFFGIYNDLTVYEYLDFFADCYEIPYPESTRIIPELLELVDLSHKSKESVDKLSRGMKQRLSLARTLIHNPKVLILDEPASGLDPRARVEIRELLQELSRMGKTVFFSSHILSDVSEICSRVGIIENGSLVAHGTPIELQNSFTPLRRIRFGSISDRETILQVFSEIEAVSNLHFLNSEQFPIKFEVNFNGNLNDLGALFRTLVNKNINIVHFSEVESSLEEIYLHATRGIVS